MGNYRIFDGTNWVDPCVCSVHVRSTVGWQLVDPANCPVKYFDGTQWCDVDCSTPACNCPEGYFNDPLTNICTRVDQTPATPSGGVVYELYKPILTSPPHGDFGFRLYNDITPFAYPINAWKNTTIPPGAFGVQYQAYENNGVGANIGIQATCAVTAVGSTGNKTRLQISSIWPRLPGSNPVSPSYVGSWPNDTWWKVEYCITIDEEKQYVFGFGGDNAARATIDSTTFNGGGVTNIVNLRPATTPNGTVYSTIISETFKFWHMFPITLPVGTHRLILEGYNLGATAYSFGAEIYNVDETYMKNVIMTGGDSIENHILFSTASLITTPKLLIPGPGQTITWSCPDETYEFNDCYGAPSCVIIDTTDCI